MLSGINPIDDLFKRVKGKEGIPSGSVVIIGQDEPDDASRFILYNLIFNFVCMKYKCIFVISDKPLWKVIQEFNNGIYKKNDMIKLLSALCSEEKECFEKIRDAEELSKVKIEDLKTIEEFMESGNVYIIDYYSYQITLSASEKEIISKLKRTGGYFLAKKVKDLHETIDTIYQKIRKKDDTHELVIVYNNSSIILEGLDKCRNNEHDFLELFHAKDSKMTIFHLFNLSSYEDDQKYNLIDKADGFIHLKCERKKTDRPLRSVGISKMRGSRYSSAYNAFRVDEYKIVKLLK